MASLIRDPNGRKRIAFTDSNKRRRAVRLGKATQRQAESLKFRIEQLSLSTTGVSGVVDNDTVQWLAGLDDGFYAKLAAVGLVEPRTSTTLGAFIGKYISERTDVKTGTTTVYGHTQRNLINYFGAGKPLREITRGDADKWRLYLIEQGLADNTVRRRSGIAKQFMRAALRRNLISSNPFGDLASGTRGNAKRFYFITAQEAGKVFEACPDTQWRLIFALSRYGGLRCPSEHLALKWADIDWERSRMLIHSCKTEHHEGGESRVCPIFPELLPYLREAFEAAEEGSEYVVTIYRGRNNRNTNLRTQFLRIVHKAGLNPWPRLFQNLRSTRQTELCQKFPEHIVCAWIGNSRPVAREHYLQVTDADFERAIKPDEVTKDAAQNEARPVSELSRIASHPVQEPAFCDIKRDPAMLCETSVGRAGFEPA